eukprot:3933174-Prymnesium_polylepis.1
MPPRPPAAPSKRHSYIPRPKYDRDTSPRASIGTLESAARAPGVSELFGGATSSPRLPPDDLAIEGAARTPNRLSPQVELVGFAKAGAAIPVPEWDPLAAASCDGEAPMPTTAQGSRPWTVSDTPPTGHRSVALSDRPQTVVMAARPSGCGR